MEVSEQGNRWVPMTDCCVGEGSLHIPTHVLGGREAVEKGQGADLACLLALTETNARFCAITFKCINLHIVYDLPLLGTQKVCDWQLSASVSVPNFPVPTCQFPPVLRYGDSWVIH